MSDVVVPDYIEHSARMQAEHYRKVAARFRLMADIEPLASVRRHLRWLAAQHDELADTANVKPAARSADLHLGFNALHGP